MFRDNHHLGWAAIEPKAFKAHEAVLTQIPYFKKWFDGRLLEAETKELKLPEDSSVAFEQVLEFAYRGKCRIIVLPKDPIPSVSKEASD
jgi:BTB/POZ domain